MSTSSGRRDLAHLRSRINWCKQLGRIGDHQSPWSSIGLSGRSSLWLEL